MPEITCTIIILCVIAYFLYMYIKRIMTPKKDLFIENNTLFKTYEITSKEQLETEIFNVFSQVEEAKTTEDYEAINYLCSKELSQRYKKELENLKEMELKYTNKNFELQALKLNKVEEKEGGLLLTVTLETNCISYKQSGDGDIVDGSITNKEYKKNTLTIKKDLKKEQRKCPNCNAPVEKIMVKKCPYCNTPTHFGSTKWTLVAVKEGDTYE